MDLEIHAVAGIQWRQDECEKQGALYRIGHYFYLVASRKITNATEMIADRNIISSIVNLKVFCVMKLVPLVD